ncbi:GIP, partial [Symbiodinium pilosum]
YSGTVGACQTGFGSGATVLRDLEDRVSRLRTLLEEEEILQEEYRRLGDETRGHLQDARGQVSQYLEEVHSHLAHVESLRTMLCLRSLEVSSSSSASSGAGDMDAGEVDYESLLEAREEDLQVVHTVPLQQVRVVLERWTDAIRKEVENLLATGTVRAVTAGEIRQMERSGTVVMAPSKCVFTLKPPSQREQRYKRKCRLMICGNFVESQGVDLYAAGIGTDGLRTALVLAAIHKWAAATSDITGAFLLDEVTDTLVGLLVTCVDDILYFGERAVVLALHAFVEEEWPASSLEWINPTDAHSTLLPVPREWGEAVENDPDALESDFGESTLRIAQKAVGEALWLATKSRPDILFVVNHMATYVSRQPSHVIRVGQRLLAYLSGRSDMRLLLGPRGEVQDEIVCFTDASYAPFGRMTLAGAPIAWRASRQSFITLSVMEAELYAATQGCLLMEALAIDNSSAASMCAGGAGSQRTRRLKIRANYIREATQAGTLSVRHTPGEYQLADLATKLQPKLRLWRLLTLWGFVGERLSAMVKTLKIQLMSVVLLLSSLFVPVEGAGTSPVKQPLAKTGWEELCFLLVVTCVAVIGIWEASKAMFRSYKKWANWINSRSIALALSWFGSTGNSTEKERSRVVKDVLKLLTCEELRAALRGQGFVTS